MKQHVPGCFCSDPDHVVYSDNYRRGPMGTLDTPAMHNLPTPRMQTPPDHDELQRKLDASQVAQPAFCGCRAADVAISPGAIVWCPKHMAAGLMRTLLQDTSDDLNTAMDHAPQWSYELLVQHLTGMQTRIEQLLREIRDDERARP